MTKQTSTRVDLYFLKDEEPLSRITYACRIAEKAFTQQYGVYLYVESDNAAEELDNKLWTFRDVSFVPHSIGGKDNSPVQIGTDRPSPAFQRQSDEQLLINLTGEIPIFAKDFSRVVEIYTQNPSTRQKAETQKGQYQSWQVEMHEHEV